MCHCGARGFGTPPPGQWPPLGGQAGALRPPSKRSVGLLRSGPDPRLPSVGPTLNFIWKNILRSYLPFIVVFLYG